ncbi:integral membrane protein MviN [Hydrogenobacter thermophilus TK-6]|uniref:Probable lipid II flippase MurJ n=1 Tax=Hydrogenobacter thermophilus (strain DSM 6534 / IAM 12695 / TK-6) TaxID=608538 RepID=D3DHH7_HYDTT|nr:murein biosynthesis integral membrane protein MurJ [Hydrogenobacter thermophilus]ADO45216.1 integral membrane protein MviN [Hydrogenobacter thermophilus TK-6]BAI69279.1 virulence factor MviN homolog [Hydrogenobacter thermophilus TK-6]
MGLIKHSLSFSVATLLSRVLGYVRDALIAYYFGVSYITDAFFIAFRLPNTFRRLLGEGGFNAAFVPIYARDIKSGREREFLSSSFTYYSLLNLLITLLGIVFAEYIVSLIAPGIRNKPHFELTVFMSCWLFTYLFFVGLSSFFMAVLNTKGVFFVPAFAQAVFNIVFSGVLAFSVGWLGFYSLIAGVILGGIAQALFNIPSLIKTGVRFGLSLRIDPELKLLVKRLLPSLLGFGVAQLSFFIDTFLASFLALGSISYLYYANRIFQLPLGAVSVGIANSLLSTLSRGEDAKVNTRLAFRFVLLVSIPASIGLIVLSEHIIALLYGRGRFSESDVYVASSVLGAYALGLTFFSLQKVLSSVFFAKGDTKTPVKASLIAVVSEGLSGSFYAFALKMGVVGLALGTSTSSLVGFAYLLLKARDEAVSVGELLKLLFRPLLASASMSLVAILLKELIINPLYTLVIIPLAMAVYFLSLLTLKEPLSLVLLGRLKGFVKQGAQP